MNQIMEFIRRRSGTVAAASAIAGFAVGAVGAYQIAHTQSAPPILLRQATEGDPMASYEEAPGAAGVLILLRNDGTTPVEVVDAAFSRTSAAPPLYIAPEMVPPGAEVNVYVPIPGACFNAIAPGVGNGALGLVITRDSPAAPPVQVLVSAHEPDGPDVHVPVEVVGQLANIMAACHNKGSG